MDDNGQTFYGNGIKLWKDGAEHGQIHLGYTYVNWNGEEVKTFDHGLVFETSEAKDGGFALRDRLNNRTPISYSNKYGTMTLDYINTTYVMTDDGDNSGGENLAFFVRLYINNGDYHRQTLWYYAGILVKQTSGKPSGYSEYNGGYSWGS